MAKIHIKEEKSARELTLGVATLDLLPIAPISVLASIDGCVHDSLLDAVTFNFLDLYSCLQVRSTLPRDDIPR
jgi:hypothetical protein